MDVHDSDDDGAVAEHEAPRARRHSTFLDLFHEAHSNSSHIDPV